VQVPCSLRLAALPASWSVPGSRAASRFSNSQLYNLPGLVGVSFNLYNHAPGRSFPQPVQSCAWSECPSTCAIMRLAGVSLNLYNHAPGRSVLQPVQSCAWSECPSTCTIMRLVGVSLNLYNHAPGRSVLQSVQSCAWSECPSICAIMRLVGVSFNLCNHAPGRSVLQPVQLCAWSECPSTCTIMRLVGVSFNLYNHAPGLLSCHSKMARSETCGQHIFALAVCCHCLQLHICKVSSHTRFSFTFYEPNSTLPWL